MYLRAIPEFSSNSINCGNALVLLGLLFFYLTENFVAGQEKRWPCSLDTKKSNQQYTLCSILDQRLVKCLTQFAEDFSSLCQDFLKTYQAWPRL